MTLLEIFKIEEKGKSRGKLLEVKTGEGKSIIISSVAIILGLCGYKVDIITTSMVLAKRDAD